MKEREHISQEEAIKKLYECLNEIEWLCSDHRLNSINYIKEPYILELGKNPTKEEWVKHFETVETFGIRKYAPDDSINIMYFLKDLGDVYEHLKNKFSKFNQ